MQHNFSIKLSTLWDHHLRLYARRRLVGGDKSREKIPLQLFPFAIIRNKGVELHGRNVSGSFTILNRQTMYTNSCLQRKLDLIYREVRRRSKRRAF